MDDLDLKILKVLQADSRKSFRDIAKDVDSTPATVISRIEKMEEIGIIKGYTAQLDYEKLGFERTAIINLQIDGERGLTAIGEDFSNHPNVLLMYETAGETDILILVKFRTHDELKKLRDEILKKDYIRKSTTLHIEHIYKERLGVSLD